MQTSNANQELRSKDVVWYLLGEYSPSNFLSDAEKCDKITAGQLSQAVRELSIPIERVENIEMTLRSLAREALAHFKQGRVELLGRIRIFCQKKMIDDANSTETTRFIHTKQAAENEQMIHHASTKMNGGWGYFLIERGGNVSTGSSVSSRNSVDLYLYKEGE